MRQRFSSETAELCCQILISRDVVISLHATLKTNTSFLSLNRLFAIVRDAWSDFCFNKKSKSERDGLGMQLNAVPLCLPLDRVENSEMKC